jgi:hypothetical protein
VHWKIGGKAFSASTGGKAGERAMKASASGKTMAAMNVREQGCYALDEFLYDSKQYIGQVS